MVRRIASLVVVGALVAACSGGSSGGGGPAASEDGGGGSNPGATLPAGGDSSGGAVGRASGAKVRIVNAYTPLNGDPGPIDIYAEPWASEGDRPLLSVPYGTVSDWFDPTVADEQGDMFLSAYWAGTTGNGNSLIDQTETLKGGEAITFFVATGSEPQESGRRYGAIQAFYGQAGNGEALQNTPASGKARLVVTAVGLDNVLANPDAATWYLSLGNGCTKGVGDDEFTQTALSPGAGASYDVDPGANTAAIHAYGMDNTSIPDCSNAAIVGDIPLTLAADRTTALFIFAPKDGDLRTLVVPLQP